MLYQILEISIIFNTAGITIKIKIPIVENIAYKVHQLHALPVTLSPQIYQFINVKEEYLAVSSLFNRFLGITETQLKNCKKVNANTKEPLLRCAPETPVETGEPTTCAAKLFKSNQELPAECKIHVARKISFIYTLGNPNSWLVYPDLVNKIEVMCEKEDAETITIQQSILLQVAPGCHFTFGNLHCF